MSVADLSRAERAELRKLLRAQHPGLLSARTPLPHPADGESSSWIDGLDIYAMTAEERAQVAARLEQEHPEFVAGRAIMEEAAKRRAARKATR